MNNNFFNADFLRYTFKYSGKFLDKEDYLNSNIIDDIIKNGNDYDSIKAYTLKKLNISYEALLTYIYRFKTSDFYIHNKELIDKIENLIKIPEKTSFINTLESIGSRNILDLINDYVIHCEQSLMNTKKITEYPILKNIDGITVRDGTENIEMLISVVKKEASVANNQINLNNYLEEYDEYNNVFNQSYQSLSFIGNNYLGIFGYPEQRKYIFGYQGYDAGFITGTATLDNYSNLLETEHIINQREGVCLDKKNILQCSYSIFNEVTAYRRNEYTNSILKPSCVICLNEIDNNAMMAAKKFNIDIIAINSQKIAKKNFENIINMRNNSNTLYEKLMLLKEIEKYQNSSKNDGNITEMLEITKEIYTETLNYVINYILTNIEKTNNIPDNTFIDKYKKYIYLYELKNYLNYINYTANEAKRILGRGFFDSMNHSYNIENIENNLNNSLDEIMNNIKFENIKLSLNDIVFIENTYFNVLDDHFKRKLSDIIVSSYIISNQYPKDVTNYIFKGYDVLMSNDCYIITKDSKIENIIGNKNEIIEKKNLITKNSIISLGDTKFKISKNGTILKYYNIKENEDILVDTKNYDISFNKLQENTKNEDYGRKYL